MTRSHEPFDYLMTCSTTSLESFELSRFNRIANLRKELREILDEWIDAEVEVRLARLLLNQRRIDTPGSPQAEFDFPQLNGTLPFLPPNELPALGDDSRPPPPALLHRRLVQSAAIRTRHGLHDV